MREDFLSCERDQRLPRSSSGALDYVGVSGLADEFDILQPVCVTGSADVHLAPAWDEPSEALTVCGLRAERLAAGTFGKSGCLTCASQAVEAGIPAVRHLNGSIVNLERFVGARKPRH
jgi:hypothetical protein